VSPSTVSNPNKRIYAKIDAFMARSKNKRTLLREAELEAIRAGTKKDVLTSIYVMEHIMEYFFFRAKGMRAVGNHDKAERYYLHALTAAEKIAPYKYARLSATKLAGDPNAPKDLEEQRFAEELKAMVEFHLERVAPVLNLQVIPINPSGPVGGIANCDAPQGRTGNDAEAPQGRRRASVGYYHD
jgi:hypothetical protein